MFSWGLFRTKLSFLRKKTAWASLLLLLLLTAALQAAEIRCKWSGVEKIVAVADIHGAYENFVAILQGVELIDEDLNWIGGDTHLVQLGDILDRGPNAKDTFDLIMKLEKQAEKAGGIVHVLLGNHEEVNITGIVFDSAGYVTSPQYKSFLPEKYIEKKELPIRKKYAQGSNSDGELEIELESELEVFWQNELDRAQEVGSPGGKNVESWEIYCKSFNKTYGKWLLTKNLAIKINDIIFVHGGFSSDEDWLNMSLNELNDAVRREYAAVARYVIYENGFVPPIRFVGQARAPQWYRGHVRNSDDFRTEAEQILNRLKCNYMVIGHTVRKEEDLKAGKLDRFGGQVWAIDVGISKFYNDVLCALIIERAEKPGEKHNFVLWTGEDEN
jgi:Icc-related predicted phosphoesterase